MERLEFEVEFLSPAFVGGAEPKVAELRPTSFVGLFRWWWKVVLATFLESSEEIYRYEGEIWGTQESAGKVYLRVRPEKILTSRCTKPSYLLGLGGKGREFISPPSSFKLEVLTLPKYREVVKDLVELALSFGGIGYRARKGFGSMRLRGIKVNYGLLKPSHWEEVLGGINIKKGKGLPELPNLRSLTLLRFPFKYRNWEEVITELGKIYQKLRKGNQEKTKEYLSVVNYFLRNEKPLNYDDLYTNLALGLPVMFQSRSLFVYDKGKKRQHARAQITWGEFPNSGEGDRRRASTILFNVKEDGIYALAFKGRFLPKGAKLKVQAKGKYWKLKGQKRPKPISLTLDEEKCRDAFDKILDRLKTFGFREVPLWRGS